jgi:hypothetical protein
VYDKIWTIPVWHDYHYHGCNTEGLRVLHVHSITDLGPHIRSNCGGHFGPPQNKNGIQDFTKIFTSPNPRKVNLYFQLLKKKNYSLNFLVFFFVRLLALRPLLAYCASLGW